MTHDPWKTALVAGAVLGLSVEAWTAVMALTGWYLDPVLLHLFWVVVALQIVTLVAVLRRTREGRGYGAQVGTGLVTSAVAAVVVFVGALLLLTFVFPDYFERLREAQEQAMLAAGASQAEVNETLDAAAPSRTPTGQAFAGFMGTLGTGLVVSLLAAAVLRDRRRPGTG